MDGPGGRIKRAIRRFIVPNDQADGWEKAALEASALARRATPLPGHPSLALSPPLFPCCWGIDKQEEPGVSLFGGLFVCLFVYLFVYQYRL